MDCPACGHGNPDDARFCEGCGARIASICPNCGRALTAGARFCAGCGQALSTTDDAAALAAAPPAPRPLPSSFAAGRYEVRRFLGEGGKKRVYLAYDSRLDREVALAVIKSDGLNTDGLVRVRREAQSMGRLGDHPNVVTVHDTGDDGGQPYIVSQHMPGGSVDEALARAPERRLPLEETLRIGRDVSAALQHAHDHGIVHRDLKPGNVWLSADGTASVGDFGLARTLDRSRLTLAGTMVGTVAYMPPEQALGGDVTSRSDLYALGCMLYEMVTGRPPFVGDDPTAVISQHINTPPVAPSWLTDHCPTDLEELILRLLAKDPAERPESGAVVREVLERVDPKQKSASHSESNVLDRLARGVFVGRERELESLRKAFDEAFGGHGGMLLLVGEPGIGKTRTAQELETYARLRGAHVLWGRAHEGAGAPAYWPWIQAGNEYAASNDLAELLPDMQGKASYLVPIFPVLRQGANFVEPEPLADAEARQFRLFDAYTTFVRAIAARGPLVIALDDLHWADKPTLQLLQHLARELSRLRVLVVGTYRDTDLVRTHPLSETLAALNREAGFQRVVLRGLSRAEVLAYIRAAAALTPRAELVDRIFEETEGNPFFLSEVVNLLTQEGKLTESVSDIAVPDGVREALGRRLDRISQEANELLQVAAVVGREFTYDTLTLLGERDGDALLRLIEEALEARVVEEMKQPGRYRFTHALMQETLLDELSTTRRVRIHGQVGEALEKRWGGHADERAPRLAEHFVEAAMLSPHHAAKAVHYAKLAAEQAEAQFAWDVAARHYEHCVTLVSESEDGLAEDEAALLVCLGRCARDDGDYRQGWRSLMRAITLFRARGDGVSMARATLEALSFPTDPVRRAALVRDALAMLGGVEPYLEAYLISYALETQTAGSLDDEERAHMRGRADQLVEEGGFDDVRGLLLNSDARRSLFELPDFEEAARLALSAHEILARIGRPREASLAAFDTAYAILSNGELDRGLRAAEDALAYARSRHIRWYEEVAAGVIAAVHLARANLAAFDAFAEDHAADVNFHMHTLRALRAQYADDHDRAIALLPDPSVVRGYPLYVAQIHAMRARVLANAGRAAQAQEELATALTTLRGHPDAVECNGAYISMLSVVPIAEAASALGADSVLTVLARYIEQRGSQLPVYDPVAASSMHRVRALIALAAGESEQAAELFESGLAWCERERCPVESARCVQGLAQVAQCKGDVATALRLLDQAATTFRTHGARFDLRRALALKLDWQGASSSDPRTSLAAVTLAIEEERPDITVHAAEDGTVTIMFGDIEDSTPLNQRLGDEPYAALLREYGSLVRTEVERHGGHVVKHIGDGFMAAFARPHQALRGALAIQRDVGSQTLSEPLRVRIGLHAGSPVRQGDDFFGVDVTLASRITGLACGGEVIASSALRDLVSASADANLFGEPRAVELKGLSGTHDVHTVEWRRHAG